MLLAPKPQLNLFAGWQFLLSRRYRQETRELWQSEPLWIVAAQMTAGLCSLAFPLVVIGLLAFVLVSRGLCRPRPWPAAVSPPPLSAGTPACAPS